MAISQSEPVKPAGLASKILLTAIGIISTFLIVIAINALADQNAVRFDVTSTGSLKPSERTQAVLSGLNGSSEIILAANLTSPSRDRAAMSRVLDMLDELDRASSNLRTTVINTGTPEGINTYGQLVERLSTERASETQSSVDIALAAMGSLERLGSQMQAWAQPVQNLSKEHAPDATNISPWTNELTQLASYLRVRSREASQVSVYVDQHLSQTLGSTPVPNVSQARSLIVNAHSVLDRTVRTQIEDLLARSQDADLSTEGKATAESLARSMQTAVDEAAILIDVLKNSPLPVLSRVASALASGEAAIVIGSDGASLMAITIDDLAPSTSPGAARIDAGRRAETLLVSALASSSDATPGTTVVLIHASDSKILGDQGIMRQLQQSMAVRNTRWIEWPISISPDKPVEVSLAANDPNTVYVIVGLSMTTAGGPERAIKTGAVLNELIDSGANVLVNLSPSTMQGVGEPDPIATPLEALGLAVDSGRPTLVAKPVGDRLFVEWEQLLMPGESGHPLADVIKSQPTRLTWPIAIDRTQEIGKAWPLLRATADNTWRESEWLGYWLERDTNRPAIENPPQPGGSRDGELGEGVFAWALERHIDSGQQSRPQRIIVVGSHLWMFDMVAKRTVEIDGKLVETSSGNSELAHASISWLSNHDEMISRSAQAEAFPIVQPMQANKLSAARWFFIGGLPILVLIAGAVVRLIGG